MTFNPFVNGSLTSQPVTVNNFCPQYSASLLTSGTSGSITFPVTTGTLSQTFKITNRGSNGAYLGWGKGSATAVASSGTPMAHCDFIGAGEVLTQNFQISTGVVDTIAAIQQIGATTLEISIGFGQ